MQNKKMHQQGDVKLLIDWFSFTVTRFDILSLESDEQYIVERIQRKLLLTGLSYERRSGRQGWSVCYTAQGISICVGGRDDIWIEMSGSGCRAWETLNPLWTWERYLQLLKDNYPSLHYSRVDIACDTFGLLDAEKICNWTRLGKYVSRWKSPERHESDKKRVCYFGSTKSDFVLRIYDKTLERKSQGIDEGVPENWVRLEFQLRNKAILSFLKSWADEKDLSAVFFGLLYGHLIFTQRVPDREHNNQSRAVIAPWWKRLLGNVGKIKMSYAGGLEYNLEHLKKFVVRQAGGSIRAYVELLGPEQLLQEVSLRPLNDKQWALLEQLHK